MARPSYWRREASSALEVLQHELNRLLEEYIQPSRFRAAESSPTDPDPTTWNPASDIYETPDEMIVVIEVPGVDPATIDLSIVGNVMLVRGVKEPGNLPEPVVVVRERRFGPFVRQLTLPNEVDFDRAHAEAKEGVLIIRLPKPSAAQPRTIPIRPS
jgi:HSP20 family protein